MTTHDTLPSSTTRERLIEAAGEAFAEHGFQGATIKDICLRAEANIAAVNYHFRDKNTLYLEVLRFAQKYAREKYPHPMPDSGLPPEERLREYVVKFMMRILDTGRPAWHSKLMAREMVDPTAALDEVVKETVAPNFTILSDIVRDLLGGAFNAEEIRLATSSVLSQCLFYFHCRNVIERLSTGFEYSEPNIRHIAAHIADFSLAAIAKIRADRK